MDFLLVGLGNIGNKYLDTRHNVGFRILEKISDTFSVNFINKKNLFSDVAKISIKNNNIILSKPTTYMNLSGKSTLAVMNFYKIQVENIVVFHDDLDLELFNLKIKKGGGDGGHNGLKSISSLCSKNYIRARIGIDRPLNKDSVSDYVLGKFNNEDLKTLDVLSNNISENIESLLTTLSQEPLDFNGFLNKVKNLN